MSKKLITSLVTSAAVTAALIWLAKRTTGMDIGIAFVLYLFGGTAVAIVLAKIFLPGIGDAVSGFILSGGGRMTDEEIANSGKSPKVVAMLARGDFVGAIKEYEMALHRQPTDLHAMGEIAKIQAENLNEPETAVAFLREHLNARSWPVDGEAFILFRIADIHRSIQHDRERSEDILEQIQARFPKTRHSANAREKLEKWRNEDAREDLIQRRKTELGGAS